MVQSIESSLSTCDLCGHSGARRLYTTIDRLGNSEQQFWIAECEGCSVLRTFPPMSESELSAFYPNDYWGDEAEPAMEWIRSSQSDKLQFLKLCNLTSGRILDVGCGSGFFLRALDAARWERFGVEIGHDAASAAKRALGNDRVVDETLHQAQYADSEFDVVSMWSALEHTNHPRGTLQEARRILKPGGSLILQVPNAGGYQLKLFGGRWFALDAPRHRYHFNARTLNIALTESGFSIYRKTLFSRPHNAHALRQSLKAVLWPAPTRALFYLSIPFLKPFDLLMTSLGSGATLTVAARKD